jgi:hypothetical protein
MTSTAEKLPSAASADVARGKATPSGWGKEPRHVVRIRPQRAKADGAARWRPIHDGDPNISLILSLAKYERDAQEDDYRKRMILNGLAFVVIAALIAIGFWLATNIDG